MARRRVKLRFFVLLGVCAAVVLAIVLSQGGNRSSRIEQGELTYEREFNTVVVRDEKLESAANFGKIVFFVAEGERVSKGAKIAEIYRGGYNDKLLDDLVSVQTKIKNYIEETQLKNVINNDLAAINAKIDEVLDRITAAVQGKSDDDALVLQQLLLDHMEERQRVQRNIANTDTTLAGYYAEEATIKERLEAWKTEVFASDAGMVSFYFDGCESFLTPESIDLLTRDDLLNLLSGAKPGQTDNTKSSQLLYRLVNNYKWYCLILVDEVESDELEVGATYSIDFSGFYAQPYSGKIIGSKQLELSTLFVVEIDEDISTLLGVRQAKATFTRKYPGLVVENGALQEKENILGITVIDNNGKTFVPVRVVYDDGKRSVVESTVADRPLAANMKVEVR